MTKSMRAKNLVLRRVSHPTNFSARALSILMHKARQNSAYKALKAQAQYLPTLISEGLKMKIMARNTGIWKLLLRILCGSLGLRPVMTWTISHRFWARVLPSCKGQFAVISMARFAALKSRGPK